MASKIDGKQIQNAPNGVTGSQINSGTVTSTNVDSSVVVTSGANAMTGNLVLGGNRVTGMANGVAGTDGATVSQVTAAASGITAKSPVQVLSASNITLSGEQTIDGVLTSSSRVLVTGQTTATQNGIYVTGSGAWTRSTDMPLGSTATGVLVYVSNGTTYATQQWICTTPPPSVVGSNAITFSLFALSSPPTRPTGLNKGMAGAATTADNQLATSTAVAASNTNGGDVYLNVNGCGQRVGNGTKTGVDCYVSGDGGTTARTFANVQAGDAIYWNGSVAGFQLATSDFLDLFYSESYV